MKLAIIGNSHIGSLKRGWDTISSDHETVEIVFFGARRDDLKGLEIAGSKLVPATDGLRDAIRFTSGGHIEIKPDDFDVILVYGTAANAFFRAPGQFYSAQAIKKSMRDVTDGRLYFEIAKMIRKISERPIFIGHSPLPAETRQTVDQSTDAYSQGLALMNEAAFASLPARMISQPIETIVNGNKTDAKYSKGSKRLAVGDRFDEDLHSENDIGHMNEEFGAMWLEAFLGEVGMGSKGRFG